MLGAYETRAAYSAIFPKDLSTYRAKLGAPHFLVVLKDDNREGAPDASCVARSCRTEYPDVFLGGKQVVNITRPALVLFFGH